MSRETFILHTQQMSALAAVLSDDQLGRLMRAVFDFESNVEPVVDADILGAWAMLRVQLQSNRDRYESIVEKRRESARLGGVAKAAKCQQMEASGSKCQQMEANAAKSCHKDNDIDNDNKKEIIISKDIIKKENETEAVAVRRFVKPTVEQVAAYCAERHNSINAQQFVDHYEANGWRRGNTPVKDWKACVRTWEQRDSLPRLSTSNRQQTAVEVQNINDFRYGDNQY